MSSSERWSWIALLVLSVILGFKGGQFYERKKTSSPQQLTQVDVEKKGPLHLKKTLPQRRQTIKDQLTQEGKIHSSAPFPPLLLPTSSSKNPFQCPPPPQLECPPCDCRPPKKKVRKKGKRIPPPPTLTPLERRKLLAWVKRNAVSLKSCRDASQPIYRLTVTLSLKKKTRGINSVVLKGRNLPHKTRRCIETKIKKWPLDPSLNAQKHPQLVFGLQLD